MLHMLESPGLQVCRMGSHMTLALQISSEDTALAHWLSCDKLSEVRSEQLLIVPMKHLKDMAGKAWKDHSKSTKVDTGLTWDNRKYALTCSGRLMSEGIQLGAVSMVPLWLLCLFNSRGLGAL